MEKIPNCYKCKKKESGEFKSTKTKVELEGRSYFPLICFECKEKENEFYKADEN
ncbi:MAG: hypothetical protein I3273_06130 [Candidatus Moeniiplasma glomeromycotorum]|nr:hypothetical protein [Candidatus Moeniiplasma glomeromycotorum]MCE8162368.1 hypothetical protein [Candidatus Moeniiplasma glomeromycotorum]MCE8163813.1 hypothetical protein [Candidatus Moeniiplasma glomeromycotorum]MCE8166292.1 hypothetical protein [Candidatus Moeniiplasma glomeromycotorum]MCE8166774.1 hypothetical protein [Candidatus Moeniiplasma glomeromycotorum]